VAVDAFSSFPEDAAGTEAPVAVVMGLNAEIAMSIIAAQLAANMTNAVAT
jgi:hypothetical protein